MTMSLNQHQSHYGGEDNGSNAWSLSHEKKKIRKMKQVTLSLLKKILSQEIIASI